LWIRERRRWVRWLGTTALAGVVIQGLLGGFRVKLDRWLGTDLALIHGCFAQAVFALLVSVALVTSGSWKRMLDDSDSSAMRRARRWSLLVNGLVYLQIVFGAVLRHTYSTLGPRIHLLLAFGVTAAVTCLLSEILNHRTEERRLVMPGVILAFMVAMQLFLGVEAWMFKYLVAGLHEQAVVRTAHVLIGALIFATSVVVTLQAFRGAFRAAWSPTSSTRLGEAA
jgi:cytochrome c oxidase assembly protein subunit 15